MTKKTMPITQTQIQRLLAQLYCLDDNDNIIFLCDNNILLSPFAESYLKVLCREVGIKWNIFSTSLNNSESESENTLAIEEASKLGIDLSSHGKQQDSSISPSCGKTLLFTFDNENHTDIEITPATTFNLCHFIPRGLGSYQTIDSSTDDDIEDIKHCYLLIAEALKNIFEHYRVL
ncbi:hypothetical protein EYS14_14135 [Alteromonadaceae bacterium M269]|nr:hypothetical protein EYS14_14135 [Alteromonadaceae bacterium M269]